MRITFSSTWTRRYPDGTVDIFDHRLEIEGTKKEVIPALSFMSTNHLLDSFTKPELPEYTFDYRKYLKLGLNKDED